MKHLAIFLFLLALNSMCHSQFNEGQILVDSPGTIQKQTVADLDLDGDMDIIVAMDGEGFGIFLNLGAGNFDYQVLDLAYMPSVTDLHGESFNVVDIDNDEILDLIYSDQYADSVYIFRGQGDLNFENGQVLNGASPQNNVQVSDLNNDGNPDILFRDYYANSTLFWCENLGDAEFSLPQSLISDIEDVNGFAVQDINGDGFPEIALSTSNPNTIVVQNEGVFPLTNWSELTTYSGTLKWIDIDSDDDKDLVVSHSSGVSSWLENEAGVISSVHAIGNVMSNYNKATPFDFDLDGDIDLLMSSNELEFTIEINDGQGEFTASQIIENAVQTTQYPSVADITGNGQEEIIYIANVLDRLTVLQQTSLLVFEDLNLAYYVQDPKDIHVIDIDQDGDLDILGFGKFPRAFWLENEGNENFGEVIPIEVIDEVIAEGGIVDWDGDGLEDVVIVYDTSDDYLAWYKNNGNQEFIFQESTDFQWITPHPHRNFVGDLNNDGKGEVLIDGTLSVGTVAYLNEEGEIEDIIYGTGQLTALKTWFGDLDNDDIIDLVYLSQDQQIKASTPNSNLQYGNGGVLLDDDMTNLSRLLVADIDDEPMGEVILQNPSTQEIGYYHYHQGDLVNWQVITDNSPNHSIYADDLDHDNDMDLILSGNSQLTLLKNSGAGLFAIPEVILNQNGHPYFADFEGDGDSDIVLVLNNDDIYFIENLGDEGCTNSAACNYNPQATTDNGECCYEQCGCTSELAANYSSQTTCDDGSCLYQIEGVVFFDMNENGIQDIDEPNLPYQYVFVSGDGNYAITDEQGQFSLSTNSLGPHALYIEGTEAFPYPTNATPFVFNSDMFDEVVELGLSNEQVDFHVDLDVQSQWTSYLCDSQPWHKIHFTNLGNDTISGNVVTELSDSFMDFDFTSPADSSIGNLVYHSFDHLTPGESLELFFEVTCPGADNLGDTLFIHSQVIGFYNGEQVAFDEFTLERVLICAYDPNIKEVAPVGYTENHFISQDDTLTYTIHFQNIGTAPATNVLVLDTISPFLNVNSFDLISHSHPINVQINPQSRVAEFFFENIMLPDSATNEPESHGIFTFSLAVSQMAPPESIITNQAHIYFDSNDAIITNETFNTIFNCTDSLAEFHLSTDALCEGDSLSTTNSNDFIESYIWMMEEDTLSADSLVHIIAPNEPWVIVNLAVSNPVCEANHSEFLHISSWPEYQVLADTLICLGDTAFINVQGPFNFSWDGAEGDSLFQIQPSENTTVHLEYNLDSVCFNQRDFNIQVAPPPSTSILNYTPTFCAGEGFVELLFSGNSPWQLVYNLNDSLISMTTMNPIDSIAIDNTSALYFEDIYDSYCGAKLSDSLYMDAIDLPELILTGNTNICLGDTTELIANSVDDVFWLENGNAMLSISPDTSNFFVAMAENPSGCVAFDSLFVTVYDLPQPQFTQNGNTLTAGPGSSFQWLLNGELLKGWIQQSIEIEESGYYTLVTVNEWGCVGSSEETYITYTDVDSLEKQFFTFYPTPASSEIIFEINAPVLQVEIVDLSGKSVEKFQIQQGKTSFDCTSITAGIYIVSVYKNELILKSSKLVIIHE